MRYLGELKGKYSGGKCVVLGNGRSLSIELVEQVQSAAIYSFAVNGFCLIFDETDYRPSAVCMSNYEAIGRFGSSYPIDTLKFFKAGWEQEIDDILENSYGLPFNCDHDLGKHNAPFIKDGNFTLDPARENFCGDTVLLEFAIPLSLYMGFKEIYLLGVDCDYSKGYFCERYQVSAVGSFKGMVNGDYSIAIPSFRFAKQILNSHGCRIYKLTASNRLDFIETRSLEEAFGKNIT